MSNALRIGNRSISYEQAMTVTFLMFANMAKIYESLTPHVEYIGYIEDVNGIVE